MSWVGRECFAWCLANVGYIELSILSRRALPHAEQHWRGHGRLWRFAGARLHDDNEPTSGFQTAGSPYGISIVTAQSGCTKRMSRKASVAGHD